MMATTPRWTKRTRTISDDMDEEHDEDDENEDENDREPGGRP